MKKMKTSIISIWLFHLSLVGICQENKKHDHVETIIQVNNTAEAIKDTTVVINYKASKKIDWYQAFYMRAQPVGIYTGSGYLKDKVNQNFELGYSVGMFDFGIAVGRNALRKDSLGNGNNYLEGKITMDICQYGIYSNEMTVGGGYVFQSQDYLMLELSYTIYAQFWKNLGIGITTGFYDFSGDYTDNFQQFLNDCRPQGVIIMLPGFLAV